MIPEATGAKWLNPHLSKKHVLLRSSAVVSISQSALSHASNHWKVDLKQATVTHLAANTPIAPSTSNSPVSHPFLLFVGQRSSYKRGEWAFRAAAELPAEWRIVFAGPKFSKEEHEMVDNLDIASKVICLQPGDEDLAILYRHAQALLHMSEIEGFGLPILEAMRQETPVILGDNDINREVAGDMGCYFVNSSLQDFLLVVKNYVENPLKAPGSDYARRLRLHSESYSWKECARITARVYREALERGGNRRAGHG